eukprot:scaffold7489_cov88-Skeletonema_marinoi.AAC.2
MSPPNFNKHGEDRVPQPGIRHAVMMVTSDIDINILYLLTLPRPSRVCIDIKSRRQQSKIRRTEEHQIVA